VLALEGCKLQPLTCGIFGAKFGHPTSPGRSHAGSINGNPLWVSTLPVQGRNALQSNTGSEEVREGLASPDRHSRLRLHTMLSNHKRCFGTSKPIFSMEDHQDFACRVRAKKCRSLDPLSIRTRPQ
jgi:hypothetical protein